jgi:hypothetical protein
MEQDQDTEGRLARLETSNRRLQALAFTSMVIGAVAFAVALRALLPILAVQHAFRKAFTAQPVAEASRPQTTTTHSEMSGRPRYQARNPRESNRSFCPQ